MRGTTHPTCSIREPDDHDDRTVPVDAGEEALRGRTLLLLVTCGMLLSAHSARAQLDLEAARLLHQGTEGVIGTLEAGDEFGSSLARGDFNGDGLLDVAIGNVSEDLDGLNADAGAVLVFYGGKSGAFGGSLDTQVWVQNNIGWPFQKPVLGFGETLAAGDFNGDGYDELAIGMPRALNNSEPSAGLVWVLEGSASGLLALGAIQRLSATFTDFEGDSVAMSATEGHRFGGGLAAGDFDGDGLDDLAVGVPGFSFPLSAEVEEGAIQLFLGSPQGLEVPLSDEFANGRYTTASWDAGLTHFDRLGEVLAVGDFDGDGTDDLAMGLPNREVDGVAGAGVVRFAYGSASGLQGHFGDQFESNTADEDQRLGASLAVADFNLDGYDDVAVGVPGRDAVSASTLPSGRIYLAYGSPQGAGAFLPDVRSSLAWAPLRLLGTRLVTGDFDANGWPDLASAVARFSAPEDSGAVAIFYGASTPERPGLQPGAQQVLQQGTLGLPGTMDPGDAFGRALLAGDFDGDSIDDLLVGAADRIEDLAQAGSATFVPGRDGLCTPNAENMCLRNGRFQVSVAFETAAGSTGSGQVVPQGSDDSGLFWFFHGDNWEMLVKVLNGCPVNDRFWVLSAATTDVGFELQVKDLLTGQMKSFDNPVGQAASATIDVNALDTCFPVDIDTASAGVGSLDSAAEALEKMEEVVARRVAARAGVTDRRPSPALTEHVGAVGTCVPSPGTLCLLEDRFAVSVIWSVGPDNGRGIVVPVVSPDAGLFWFFEAANWEMLVKMVDGCVVNGAVWVFAAATTDVGYELTVRDTVSGEEMIYTNDEGVLAPAITDTSAFPTCS